MKLNELIRKSKIALAFIDCDLYSSTIQALDFIEPLLQEIKRTCKKGGILLIGDILDKKYEEEIKRNSDLAYEKKIPSIQRYSEWMFYDLKQLSKTFQDYGYRVEILTQPSHFKCSYYRRDIRIIK